MFYDIFLPRVAGTVSIAATTASASVSVAAANVQSPHVSIYNAGPNTAFVRWGVGAQTAVATTDMPIPSGATKTYTKGTADTFAAICATGTATIYFTPGEGQ